MTARLDHRVRIRIPAGCRIDDGSEFETSVLDISEEGCRMRTAAAALRPGTSLSLAIGTLAPIAGKVRWRYGTFCGVLFSRPLEQVLLQHLEHAHVRGPLKPDELPRP